MEKVLWYFISLGKFKVIPFKSSARYLVWSASVKHKIKSYGMSGEIYVCVCVCVCVCVLFEGIKWVLSKWRKRDRKSAIIPYYLIHTSEQRGAVIYQKAGCQPL